jgi:hypothetical protein
LEGIPGVSLEKASLDAFFHPDFNHIHISENSQQHQFIVVNSSMDDLPWTRNISIMGLLKVWRIVVF